MRSLGGVATLHGGVYRSPCLGGLDGDGNLDVVIQSKDGWTTAWTTPGRSSAVGLRMAAGCLWTKTYSSVSLSDLDQDGSLKSLRPIPMDAGHTNWTGRIPSYLNSNYSHFSKASPAVGDVDGDDLLEIVLGRVDDGQGSAMPSVICLENDLTLK